MNVKELHEATKPNLKRLVDLASSGNADEFIQAFSLAHNSAADMWMNDHQIKSLMKDVSQGKDIKSVSWSSDDKGKAERKIDRLKASGYKVVAEEDNVDSFEVILAK